MADIRESSVKLLTTALNKTGTANDDRASTIAQEIEEEVYQAHQGNTGNPYRNQLRSIHLDLSKNNVELANQLISGDLSAQELVGLGSEVSMFNFSTSFFACDAYLLLYHLIIYHPIRE